MKKKSLNFSVFAVIIIVFAILFTACSIGSDDPNINTTEPNTITETGENTDSNNTDTVKFSTRDCFVAQDDPIVIEYLESYDCVPCYVYFKKNVFGEIKQLFDKKSKLFDIAETVSKVYVVTEDNEFVRVNKKDGTYETVYKPQYGSIDQISYVASNSKYILFNDGDYIVKLNPNNEEYSIATHSDNGISVIYGCGGDFDKIGFYCKDCNEEYVVWEDVDGNTFWYHPEKDENEIIDWSYLYFGHPDENE